VKSLVAVGVVRVTLGAVVSSVGLGLGVGLGLALALALGKGAGDSLSSSLAEGAGVGESVVDGNCLSWVQPSMARVVARVK
jgi:hypothetical protein